MMKYCMLINRLKKLLWGDILLYIGIIFIMLGLYCIFQDFFDMKILVKEKILVRKGQLTIDDYFKIRLVVGLFAIIVGILSIVNYLIY